MSQRPGKAGPEIERAWRDEAQQRLAAIDAGHTKLAPWDDAKQRIFAAHPGEFGTDEEPLAWEAEGWEDFTG